MQLDDPVLLGLAGSLGAGLMTGAGALPVLFGRSVSQRTSNALLGFAAGVMLTASFFSLILPALDYAEGRYGGRVLPAFVASGGILLGVAAMWFLNERVPHRHFVSGPEGPASPRLEKIWLFVIAITLHNFPEGMAVGVGFASGDVGKGAALALGIGLQNMPEGLAVALALVAERYPPGRAVWIATLTGLVEPVGGVLGAVALALAEPLLPWGLTFAAGAMLYIISHEIIPETHRSGYRKEATGGLTVGLVVMLVLDVALG